MTTKGRRLTYTFDETGAFSQVSVEPTGRDAFDGKTCYRWTVEWDGKVVSGDDLRAPTGHTLARALGSLLNFLGAFAEARSYGSPGSDNWDIFPDDLVEWATTLSDELEMARLEVEGEL